MDDQPFLFDIPFACPSAVSPRRVAGNIWDIPGLLDAFIALHAEGLSHAQVATTLNERYSGVHLTRNASIGKVKRLGMATVNDRAPRNKKEVTWGLPGLLDDFRKLHAEGHPYSMMADRLNEKYTLMLTKKAVLAKAHRLGLPKRENHTEGPRRNRAEGKGWRFPSFSDRLAPQDRAGRLAYRKKIASGEQPTRLPRAKVPKEDDYTPVEMRKSLLDLERGECKWPYGDGPFTFCARKIGTSHVSYCERHAIVHSLGLRGALNFYCVAAE